MPATPVQHGLTWDEQEAETAARERLQTMLTWLRGLGAEASGEVGNKDPVAAAQDALRGTNKVRLVTEAEEGTGVNALPAGVYGFSYSPGLSSAPLFAVPRYRTFEIHKVGAETLVIAFATADSIPRASRSVLLTKMSWPTS